MMQTTQSVQFSNVEAASQRLAPWIERTPVLRSTTFDQLCGRTLYFKCENFQKTGSFKFRGAMNALLQLSPEQQRAGVVTHSSGNHAQALAKAAQLLGITSYIVMPNNAPAVKKAAVQQYGGQITECEPNVEARVKVCNELAKKTGAVLIPPFDHPHIIAGQGTATLELLQEVPHLDAVVIPVGGGGLLSGGIIAAKAVSPKIQVFGAEPLNVNDAARSIAAGDRCANTTGATSVADGLLVNIGEITFPIIQQGVQQILTVSEEEILQNMRLIWERMKIIVEPSSAVGLAAVRAEAFQKLDNLAHVGVILCGGNVAVDYF
ncbi:MAG: pyridoxal-phosphate dependent enzyme [Zavarzinella sp.]